MGFDFLNNINPFISPNPYPSSRIKKQAKRKTSPPFFLLCNTKKAHRGTQGQLGE